MTDPTVLWNLDRFPQRLELWRGQEKPPATVSAIVEEWIATRRLDPEQGARREREEDNFWAAQIRQARYDGLVVICSYWIVTRKRLVKCDLFGSVPWPVRPPGR